MEFEVDPVNAHGHAVFRHKNIGRQQRPGLSSGKPREHNVDRIVGVRDARAELPGRAFGADLLKPPTRSLLGPEVRVAPNGDIPPPFKENLGSAPVIRMAVCKNDGLNPAGNQIFDFPQRLGRAVQIVTGVNENIAVLRGDDAEVGGTVAHKGVYAGGQFVALALRRHVTVLRRIRKTGIPPAIRQRWNTRHFGAPLPPGLEHRLEGKTLRQA